MVILRQLLSTEKARKIFGKKEIEIILKQLDGIALTQSEKNRLSRDIRPKLEFIRELSECKEEFALKRDADTLRLIRKATGVILNDELKGRIKAILLFGSHAGGIVTSRSDIDIAIIFTSITPEEAARFRIRISGNLPEKVDIQAFNTLPQKVKRSIAKSHKIIYRRKGFDNLGFTINYLKDEDYFIRMDRIFAQT